MIFRLLPKAFPQRQAHYQDENERHGDQEHQCARVAEQQQKVFSGEDPGEHDGSNVLDQPRAQARGYLYPSLALGAGVDTVF